MLKGLARKVLEIPLFLGLQLQRPDFDAALVYHMRSFPATCRSKLEASLLNLQSVWLCEFRV